MPTLYTCTAKYLIERPYEDFDRLDIERPEPAVQEVRFWMLADMPHAESSLQFSFDTESDPGERVWQSTPFQTADASHNAARAARLVCDYSDDLGGDGFADEVTIDEESDFAPC